MNTFYNFLRENHVLANIEFASTKKQFTLNLSNYEIIEIPEILYKCSTLLKLYLNNNSINKLSDNFIDLTNLNTLTLDYNRLEEFPVVLCKLPELINLNVSCNKIKEIPPEIGELTKLEVFWCNNTGLERISTEIVNCQQLDTFGARGNLLKKLPDTFGMLEKLRWLTLENNQIDKLPSNFVNLKSLIHFNIRNNNLTDITEIICNKNLRYCFLNNNNITFVNLDDLSKINFIKIFDLSENRILNNNFDEFVKLNPHISYNTSEHLNLVQELSDDDENDDSSAEDWEHSVPTSEIDSTDDSGNEIDNEDITIMLPELSRFIATFD